MSYFIHLKIYFLGWNSLCIHYLLLGRISLGQALLVVIRTSYVHSMHEI